MRRGQTETIEERRLTEAQAWKAALATEVAAWETRRADVAARRTALRERAEGLKVHAASAILEGSDPKAARRERATVLAELEELEAAVAAADDRLRSLEAASQQAARRVAIATALTLLDQLVVAADAVEAAWGPVREQLAAFTLALQDAAAALDALVPGSQHAFGGGALGRHVLWPVADLLGLPSAEARERQPLPEAIRARYAASRARLERELTALADSEEAR
jgi:hypothetical protein